MGRPVADLPGKQDQSGVPYERQAQLDNGCTAINIRAWRPNPPDDIAAAGPHPDNGLLKWGGVEHAIGRIAKQPVHCLPGGGSEKAGAYVACA